MRVTSQRARVIAVLESRGHATPEEIVTAVAADGGGAVPASTVYRSLEALQEAGLVAHTHVDHRVPSYHLAEHATHIHLVCRACGRVTEVPLALGDSFARSVRAETGFVVELTHAAVHGRCASCATSGPETP